MARQVDSFIRNFPPTWYFLLGGLLAVSLLHFIMTRRSLRMQTEQQIYSKIIDTRITLENSDTFTKMARESPAFVERLSAVDNAEEYYNVIAFIDFA